MALGDAPVAPGDAPTTPGDAPATPGAAPATIAPDRNTLVALQRLTRRAQFLSANAGVRVPMPAFVLIVHPRRDSAADTAAHAGYGITATKRLGGAVVRNRVKRRFRAIIRDVFGRHAVPGADHVVIGRTDALTMDHARLTADVTKALAKARKRLADRSRPAPTIARP